MRNLISFARNNQIVNRCEVETRTDGALADAQAACENWGLFSEGKIDDLSREQIVVLVGPSAILRSDSPLSRTPLDAAFENANTKASLNDFLCADSTDQLICEPRYMLTVV
ncbi:hypothetical protein CV102_25645 [Natronococcus pandeyae]|uniref:Uncharacterized protein n=1 Tax=Natronococcus pandeyae TaxID=2055836 RepID=A0A8J8PWP8_9EURY|nr:hypothetical protein CV102_25645 [Natronococcus pandeyae]